MKNVVRLTRFPFWRLLKSKWIFYAKNRESNDPKRWLPMSAEVRENKKIRKIPLRQWNVESFVRRDCVATRNVRAPRYSTVEKHHSGQFYSAGHYRVRGTWSGFSLLQAAATCRRKQRPKLQLQVQTFISNTEEFTKIGVLCDILFGKRLWEWLKPRIRYSKNSIVSWKHGSSIDGHVQAAPAPEWNNARSPPFVYAKNTGGRW